MVMNKYSLNSAMSEHNLNLKSHEEGTSGCFKQNNSGDLKRYFMRITKYCGFQNYVPMFL